MPLFDALLALLAPERCVACGRRATPPWCDPCSAAADRLRAGAGCPRCGGRSAPHPCWRRDVAIVRTVVAFHYSGPVAAAVVAGKARGAWAAWELLGRHLAAAVVAAQDVDVEVVTWVPPDERRQRDRGFDHAGCLAGPVAAELGVPLRRLLVARPGRPDQARLPPRARMALPDDAFTAVGALPGRSVLLVDDVLTTGATARAAARTLVGAGAAPIRLAVLARAGDHALAAAPPARATRRRVARRVS
ncbi:MAG: ComF family protein [Nitriliruptorales bacterium]